MGVEGSNFISPSQAEWSSFQTVSTTRVRMNPAYGSYLQTDKDVRDVMRCHAMRLDLGAGTQRIWPWVQIQIVPPVNIPIPTRIGSKIDGAPQNGIPLVLTTTAICRL